MEKDSTAYVRLMADAVQKIATFVAGVDQDSFLADNKTQSAILMQLQ